MAVISRFQVGLNCHDDQPELAVEVVVERITLWEVSRETARERLLEVTVDNDAAAEACDDRPVESMTDPTEETDEVVSDKDCELNPEMCSRE